MLTLTCHAGQCEEMKVYYWPVIDLIYSNSVYTRAGNYTKSIVHLHIIIYGLKISLYSLCKKKRLVLNQLRLSQLQSTKRPLCTQVAFTFTLLLNYHSSYFSNFRRKERPIKINSNAYLVPTSSYSPTKEAA